MELVSQQHCKSEGTKHILLVIVYALMYCFEKNTRNASTLSSLTMKHFHKAENFETCVILGRIIWHVSVHPLLHERDA